MTLKFLMSKLYSPNVDAADRTNWEETWCLGYLYILRISFSDIRELPETLFSTIWWLPSGSLDSGYP